MAAIALVTVGVACGGGGSGSSGGNTGGAAPKAQTVDVAMKDNLFEPKTFDVSVGQTITFNLKNNGLSLHNMHIISDDVEPKNATVAPFEAGKTAELVVKFPKKGTYKFQCDLHTPDMAGTITVK